MTAILPPPPQPATAGMTIDRAGRYRLVDLLGEGGMARVYRGAIVSGEGFQREVAIKVVLPAFSADAFFFEMFKNEAWLASLLHHDNIVAVFDFDRGLDGNVFQVLEYVHGRDLEKLARTGPVPMPVAAYIMGEVLRGLAHAHTATNPESGKLLLIVHRDCTPSNVLLTYDGRVKVSDFGVAKAMHATNATQSGTAKGKPAYMSPEQLDGALDLDGRSDLFAVGVMLWELLAGRHLFVKDTDTEPQSVMHRVVKYSLGLEPLPDLGQINPLVPAGLHQLVNSLLSPKRSERPIDAASTLARLRPWIPPDGAEQLAALMASRFPGEARRPGGSAELVTVHGSYGPAGTSIAPQSTTAATAGELAKARRAGRQRRRWPLAIALGAIGATAIVTGIVLSTGGNKPTDGAATPAAASATATEPTSDAASAATLPIDASESVTVDAAPIDVPSSVTVDAGVPPVDAGKRTRGGGTRGGKRGSGERDNFVEYDLGGSGK